MRADERLEAALAGVGIPVKYYTYEGIDPEYIVYNEEAERPEHYADDAPQERSTWWQVHLFAPKQSDFRHRKEAIYALLIGAGFSVTDITTLYEKETRTIHVILNCHIIETEE